MSSSQLESLPIEIFYIVALYMPVDEILRLGSISKTMKLYSNSDILWKQLIRRDLGDNELKEYHKQKFLCSGQESPKEYYLELFRTFEKKVNDFIAFSRRFIDGRDVFSPTYPLIFEIIKKLKETTSSYESWIKLDCLNKLSLFSKQYERYIYDIDYIVSRTRHDGTVEDHLEFMMNRKFRMTALSLVRSQNILLNPYDDKFFIFSPVTQAVYSGYSEILDVILRKNNTNLFFSNWVLFYVFRIDKRVAEKKSILVHLLSKCPSSSSRVLFALIHYTKLTMEDIFDELATMVCKTTSLEDKLSILENAIAIVDGKYNNALSFYFNTVKSPFDVVAEIKSYIRSINNESINPLKVTINQPTITMLNNNMAGLSYLDISYRVKSLESLIEGIEENNSKFVNIRDDLNVINTEQCDLQEKVNNYPVGPSRFKLENLGLAILSIGVGLAFGLGLGLGAHAHIAASVLISIISTVLIFAISARYNYRRHMGPDVDSEPVVSSNATSNNNPLTTSTEATFRPTVSSSSNAITTASNLSSASNNHHSQMELQ